MFFPRASKRLKYYAEIASRDELPASHSRFLYSLRDDYSFTPLCCYDIGANLLHWTRVAKKIWPATQIVLFDAFEPLKPLYEDYLYYMGVLSDINDKTVKFYQNNAFTGGNSYYKEKSRRLFPFWAYQRKLTRSLDSIVQDLSFPIPDLVKIDVQGSELDVIKGAQATLKYTKYLIVEMQHTDFNRGAPKVDSVFPFIESMNNNSWKCIAHRFSDNGPDADYCFKNLNPIVRSRS